MRKHEGFTLLELVLVITILAIIAAMSSKLLIQGFTSFVTGQNIGNTDANTNYALEEMSRKIKTIPASNKITTATSSQLTFTDNTNTSYTYNLSSGNLVENSNILAGNATAFTLTYYDRSGNTTTTISAIRLVKMSLTLSQNNYTFTYATAVYLPNLP